MGNQARQAAPVSHFDVAIIGGGMVGASLACALLPAIRRFGLKVALIESHDLMHPVDGSVFTSSFDDRSTALSYGTRALLEQLGVWQALAGQVTPIRQIHVSDLGRFGATRLHAREHGIDALGYVTENARLGRALVQQLSTDKTLSVLAPAAVETVQPGAGAEGQPLTRLGVRQAGQLRELSAGLAVVADGGRSPVCRQLGIELAHSSYEQSAVIANVSTTLPHQHVAYERFTPNGPLALLPLNEPDKKRQCRSALVYTVASAELEQVMAQDAPAFLAGLQARFGYRLGAFSDLGKRDSYALSLQRAKEQVRPGLVVMGNAAHTLHPVAGQGFNLALRGVMVLARHLQQGLAQGRHPGELDLLQAYLCEQRQDQDKTIAFTDQLLKLFASRDPALGRLRSTGLMALDLLAPAKQLFARQAMGIGSRLPGIAGLPT